MLPDLFEKIGFNSKEAAIYTLLYQRGPNPVSTLAKLSGIKRPSVYDILKSLMDRGLVSSFKQGTATYFAIDDVRKLAFEQKERLEYADKIVEQLKLNPSGAEAMQIFYYKGLEGYRQLYLDIFSADPDEILGVDDMDNFYIGIDKKSEDEWTQERYKRGIKVRMILQDSVISREMLKQSPEVNRQIKLLPKGKFVFHSSMFVYSDRVAFFHTKDNVFTGICIQHPEIYEQQKQIFELCWSLLK